VRWREAPAEGDRKTYLILTLSRATRRFGIRDLVIGNYLCLSSFTSLAKNQFNILLLNILLIWQVINCDI
jgi:hypothetical protein